MSCSTQTTVRLYYRGGMSVMFPCRSMETAEKVLSAINNAIEQDCPTVTLSTTLITTKHLYFAEVLEDAPEVPA